MGRQKGHHLNVTAKKLLEKNPELFSTDFNANKEQVIKLGVLSDTPQERNKLAGEITNLVKRTRAEEQAHEEKHASAPSPASQA